MNPASSTDRLIRVWDLPTRLFHWTLALSVIGSIVTAKIGGNAMIWHFRLGGVALALLLFRILWGLLGGHWSRFVQFIYSPATTLRYLRGQTHADEHLDVGHNPLGSLSVFAMLTLLAAQVTTGLVSDDEIANVGPLNRFVASSTGLAATAWHKGWGADLVVALVGLHIAAITFYFFARKLNLVQPMLRGDRTLPAGTPASRDDPHTRMLALILALACGAAAVVVMRL